MLFVCFLVFLLALAAFILGLFEGGKCRSLLVFLLIIRTIFS